MEINLHLSDGRVILFTQPFGIESSDLFEDVALTDIFKREILVLRGDQSISLFPTDKIARIDISRLPTDWKLEEERIQADQIADYDFDWLRETLAAVQRQYPEKKRIDEVIVAADIELSNSAHLYLRAEFRGVEAEQSPQDVFLARLLESGSLIVRLREGGFGIINPKSIVRLTLYPVTDQGSQKRFQAAGLI